MTESGGPQTQEKKGMGTGAKVALGCSGCGCLLTVLPLVLAVVFGLARGTLQTALSQSFSTVNSELEELEKQEREQSGSSGSSEGESSKDQSKDTDESSQ